MATEASIHHGIVITDNHLDFLIVLLGEFGRCSRLSRLVHMLQMLYHLLNPSLCETFSQLFGRVVFVLDLDKDH